jgi:hypothetical protein
VVIYWKSSIEEDLQVGSVELIFDESDIATVEAIPGTYLRGGLVRAYTQ